MDLFELAKRFGVPAIDLGEHPIAPEITRLLRREVAVQYKVLPVNKAGRTLILAMVNPANVFAKDDVKFNTGCQIESVGVLPEAMERALARYYPEPESSREGAEGQVVMRDHDDDPLGDLIKRALRDATAQGATEVHVVVEPNRFEILFLIGDQLQVAVQPAMKIRLALLSRIRSMAGMPMRGLEDRKRQLQQASDLGERVVQVEVWERMVFKLPLR